MSDYRITNALTHKDGKRYGDTRGGCFKADTLLLGDNKFISELQPNDNVLSMTGEVKVVEPQVRNYDGEMIRLKATGILPIEATPEHPLLVRSADSYTGLRMSKPTWKEISQVRPKVSSKHRIHGKIIGDYLMMPVAKAKYTMTALSLEPFIQASNPKLKSFPLKVQTAWLLGLYVAEGYSSETEVRFCLNKKEINLVAQIKEIVNTLGFNCNNRNKRTAMEVACGSSILARAFVDWCGKGALNKKIPDFILFHRDLAILKAFLDGYTMGDGNKQLTLNTLEPHMMQCMGTVSKLLALQLQQAYARLGIFAHVEILGKAGITYIEGRQVNEHESYKIWYLLNPKFTHTRQMKLMRRRFFLLPVQSIETFRYSGPVYNMETEDETYLVNNVIVHNCLGKLRWIFEHTGILLSYQEVTALCKMWALESGHPDTWTYEDTWAKLHELDESGRLKEEILRLRRKKRASILQNYLLQEGRQVASEA